MTNYRFHLIYEVPMQATVEITDVDSLDEGQDMALKEFMDNNPEALDPEIIKIEEI